MRVAGLCARIAAMQSTKCWAPPSRRSSRSTLVTTTYFRPMSAMVLARLRGSSASGGLGRPWATSQKLQRRVQTSPRIMKVAVPWPKHSWMFGQLASSQTVTRRFSRSFAFSFATAPLGECARGSTTACAAPARRRTAPANARDLVAGRPAFAPASSDRRGRGDDLQRDAPCRGKAWRWSRSWRPGSGGLRRRYGEAGRCASCSARPNWLASLSSSTGLTASRLDGPPKSSIEVTCRPCVTAGIDAVERLQVHVDVEGQAMEGAAAAHADAERGDLGVADVDAGRAVASAPRRCSIRRACR